MYTGWRAFLEVQIKEVFGKGVDTHWIARAGEFLEYQSLETSTPITPRRINNFVNDLAITWTQWYDFNVSFFSVCYYCVFREQLDKEIEAPARMIGLPKASIDLHDPDWQRAVAAMHYGVDPSIAFQVLLTGPLRQAIEQWKPKEFRSLMKQQGFTEVLRKLAQGYRDVASTIPKVVVQTINMLDAEEPEGTTEFSDIWRMLHDALPKTATWDAFESDALDAIRALLKRGTPQQNGSLLLSIQNCINGIRKERASETALMTAKLWHQVAGDFDASLYYVTEIRLPGESETFVHVASVCRDDPNVISKLKTSANSASVVETLIEDLKGRVDRNEDKRLRGVFNASLIDDWTKYLSVCNADPLSGLNESTKTALLGFCLLNQQKGWQAYFESLVPRLVALVPLALAAKDFDVAGRACALLATVQPTSFPAITAKPSDDDASKFVLAFDAATKDLSGEPMTCKTALDVIRNHASTEILLGEVLTYRLRNGGGSDLTPSLYFSHFDVIQHSLAADVLPGLLQKLTTTDAFWSEFATLQLSDNWLRTFEQLSVTNPRDDRLASLLKEKLAQASEADWAAAISGGTTYASAVELLDKNAPGVEIPGLSGPLTTTIEQAITTSESIWLERWYLLAALLPSLGRQTLFRTVRDRILGNHQLAHLPLLLRLGELRLLDDGHFRDKADDFMRRIMPELTNTTEGRAYLRDFAVIVAPIFAESEDATKDSIRGWLRPLLEDADASKQETAGKLASAWGIDFSLPSEG